MSGKAFTLAELFFFRVPRTWAEIKTRFESYQRSRDSILEADCDEGRGLLDWSRTMKAWYLTEAGRQLLLGYRPRSKVAS